MRPNAPNISVEISGAIGWLYLGEAVIAAPDCASPRSSENQTFDAKLKELFPAR